MERNVRANVIVKRAHGALSDSSTERSLIGSVDGSLEVARGGYWSRLEKERGGCEVTSREKRDGTQELTSDLDGSIEHKSSLEDIVIVSNGRDRSHDQLVSLDGLEEESEEGGKRQFCLRRLDSPVKGSPCRRTHSKLVLHPSRMPRKSHTSISLEDADRLLSRRGSSRFVNRCRKVSRVSRAVVADEKRSNGSSHSECSVEPDARSLVRVISGVLMMNAARMFSFEARARSGFYERKPRTCAMAS